MLGPLVLLLGRIYADLLSLIVFLAFVLPRDILQRVGAISPHPFGAPKDGYKSVLITGASVGIGAGLAKRYAKPGVHLTLIAYQTPSLDKIVRECEAKGASVTAKYVDVKDESKMRQVVNEADAERPLDLVIANAGVVPQKDGLLESHWVIETNLLGSVNTVVPAVVKMRERKRGQIVMMSSAGGFAPALDYYMLPYVASKRGILAYAQGLRSCLYSDGIGVTTVAPGFVESRMTKKQARQGVRFLGIWSNDDACDCIVRGIAANKALVAFPYWMYMVSKIIGAVPSFIAELILVGEESKRFYPFKHMDEEIRKDLDHDVHDDVIEHARGSSAGWSGSLFFMAAMMVVGGCLYSLTQE